MRLLRLELAGFKSFPDKVSIDFIQDGVSIVVGPNGCGKSNIVDAIRWVLGEQSAKHLRGAQMEDVIFGGSTSRPAAGLAQVTLSFANPEHDSINKYSEFSEISVTRKLFRTGESLYQINKTNCRLSDIRELFMDTGIGGKGYSIIEQGKIDRIVTSSALERRALIDEAAGVIKFKSKKAEAQKRFVKSRENLDRVKDLLEELVDREQKLKLQVARADQFIEAKGRMERLQQLAQATQWLQLKEKADKIADDREASDRAIKDQELQLTNLQVKKTSLGLEQVQKQDEKERRAERISKSKSQLIKLESRIEADQQTLAHLGDWQAKGNRELEQLEGQSGALENQREALVTQSEDLALAVTTKAGELLAAKEAVRLQERELNQQIGSLEARRQEERLAELELNKKKHEIGSQAERLKEAQERGKEAEELLVQVTERLLNAQEHRGDIDRDHKEKLKELVGAQSRLSTAKAKLLVKKEELGLATQKIEDQEREYQRAESRLESLKQVAQNHEDFTPKIKALLDHFALNPLSAGELGFIGPLADLLEIGDKLEEWAQNLLGRYFNLMIFESHYHLPQIKNLMERLGVEYLEIYFLDLCEEKDSNLDYLIPWREKPTGLYLTGHYKALEKRSYQIEPADLTGGRHLLLKDKSLVTTEGVFKIGLPSEAMQLEGYLKRQQEYHRLAQETKEMKVKLDDLAYSRGWLKEEVDELEWEVTDSTQDSSRLEIETRELAKELERFVADVERIETEREKLTEAREKHLSLDQELQERRLNLDQEIALAQTHLDQLHLAQQNQSTGLDQSRLALEFAKGALQKSEIEMAGFREKTSHQKELLKRIDEELAQIRQRIGETKTQSIDQEVQKKTLDESLQANLAKLPQVIEEIAKLETDYREMADELERRGHEIRVIEEEEKAKSAKQTQLLEQRHQSELKLAQLAQEAKGYEQSLFEEWAIRPDEVLAGPGALEFERESGLREIVRLKAKLTQIGDVNLGAKAEYVELKQRVDFLDAESKDLSASIEALEESIAKIDEESKKRFNEVYKRINVEFRALFPKFFGGGEAFLKLSDPEDLLDSGVEIIAQPPGKTMQNLTLLSGGEKAMTALALIFAIFQFKPSPFCLLDEVDAPLDDANNHRFNAHVRLLTENSQFIIITHNKKTMEIGDAMFGVTMEEPGSSKVVSVDFERGQKLIEPPRRKGA